MNESETIQILGQIKAAWPKQPADEAVVSVWTRTLSTLPYQHAQVAVVELINTDRRDPPTPGQLREIGMRVWDRYEQRKQAAMRQLPEPERKPAEIQTVKAMLDDYFARNGGRPNLDKVKTFKDLASTLVGSVSNKLSREPGEEG